jgi:hypothetical protein
VLEKIFGVGYNFKNDPVSGWGVSQTEFEVLTLGTLPIITVFAVVGYWSGARVRSQVATVPIQEVEAAAAPA